MVLMEKDINAFDGVDEMEVVGLSVFDEGWDEVEGEGLQLVEVYDGDVLF